MPTIFTLASGRSGTSYLAEFFKHNILNCYSTHEPYLDPWNPTLFGKPILYNTLGDPRLEITLDKKQKRIKQLNKGNYFESNHAFLKTAHQHGGDLFEDMGLIHLVRDPRQVAKSELNRELLINKLKLPWIRYQGPNNLRLFKWSLTGLEEIYKAVTLPTISRFQFYVLQWIEIENRAMQFIQQNSLAERCIHLHVPEAFTDVNNLRSLAAFFDLKLVEKPRLELRTNQTPFVGSNKLSAQEENEFNQVIRSLPLQYRFIFREPPYQQYHWAQNLLPDFKSNYGPTNQRATLATNMPR